MSTIESNREHNLVETGGQFGWRRRLGTFVIVPKGEKGLFAVYDEATGSLKGAGFKTVDDAEAHFKAWDNERTRLY